MAVALRKFFYSKADIRFFELNKQIRIEFIRYFNSKAKSESGEESKRIPNEIDGFQVLHLYPKQSGDRKIKKTVKSLNPPRTTRMIPEQDWSNVWPGPRTYHPAVVPLPLHQGRNKYGPPPGRFANTELMKIPNFLHLTPPAIEKHCKAIKKFCTDWPKELQNDEDIEKHFPVEIITSDYCHSSPSIRDSNSRIVCLKIKLRNLQLDKHSKDKLLRLLGQRYDALTDYITITTDSCPLKKQNYEYAQYLLTAVYFESWKVEDWEKEKSEKDMEEYIFSERQAFRNVKALFDYNKRELPDTKELAKNVEEWMDKGDSLFRIEKYKENVMKLLSLPSLDENS